MSPLEIGFGIAVLLMSVVLVIAVLMQSGKDSRLSGTITGGAETFFGKAKANTWDRVLSKVTIAVSVVFALAVAAMYIFIA